MRCFSQELVKVPAMGDSISEGTVQEFVKNVGEYVELDEVIVVVETDKVTLDIRSPHAGVIKEWKAEEGDTVEVGSDFLVIDTEAAPDSKPAAPAPEKEEAPPAQDAKAADTPAPAETPSTPPPPQQSAPAPPAKEAPKPPKSPTSTPDKIGGTRNETRQKMS